MGDEISTEKSVWLRIRDYSSDVRTEMRRVTWPSKQEIYGTTIMVLLTTSLFGMYFWACDQVFSNVVSKVLRHFLHHA